MPMSQALATSSKQPNPNFELATFTGGRLCSHDVYMCSSLRVSVD